jgi:Family of unknown function (DUF6049)
MQDVRPVVRALLAVLFAAAVSVFIVPGARAATAAARTLTVSITAMSPQWATSGSTVKISGTVSNHTGSAIPDLVVQAQTGPAFQARSDLSSFADGQTSAAGFLSQAGLADVLPSSLPSGATARWSVSFPAAGFYGAFGVYPIQVLASSAATGFQATANTFLPYWAGKASAVPLKISWIWPLIDEPQQGACPTTLATPYLAQSVKSGGRLATLLGAAAPFAQADQITWAIDPALLSDVSVMTHSKYFTGGNYACQDRDPQLKNGAAAAWLSKLATTTAGQSAFLTPYADVDVAALSHNGLDANIRSAYQVGQHTASRILPGTFGTNASNSGTVLAAAWPADGTADTQVLDSLASDGGVSTVVLKSGTLPSSAGQNYDTALQRTVTSSGKPVSALLADSEITSVLGSASATSSAGARFAVTQDFLAQTAFIVAEAPNLGRSLVVAPPRGWDPSAAEVTTLLRMTQKAPWLSPTGLGTLAAQAANLKPHALPASKVGGAELSDDYLDQVQTLNSNLATYTNLLYQPAPSKLSSLAAAVAVTESVAWRGDGSPGGWLALTKLSSYLAYEMDKVSILSTKPILLAGTSGTTLVSVQNLMDVPVRVRVYASTATGSALSVGSFDTSTDSLKVIQPFQTNTVRMPLQSTSIGTTTLQLELVTANGSPVAGTARLLSVEVTRIGRTLLVIIGAALGVLVLTSAIRLRRRRKAGGRHSTGAEEVAESGGAG